MNKQNKERDIQPADLPESEVFVNREIYQQKQPADTGVPLNNDLKENERTAKNKKEAEKTSKEEGLNQARSSGEAGAFEGLEDLSE
jgi:hypothetical protein